MPTRIRWRTAIHEGTRVIRLGPYDHEETAAIAYDLLLMAFRYPPMNFTVQALSDLHSPTPLDEVIGHVRRRFGLASRNIPHDQ